MSGWVKRTKSHWIWDSRLDFPPSKCYKEKLQLLFSFPNDLSEEFFIQSILAKKARLCIQVFNENSMASNSGYSNRKM
jgi:hypothetical protein